MLLTLVFPPDQEDRIVTHSLFLELYSTWWGNVLLYDYQGKN